MIVAPSIMFSEMIMATSSLMIPEMIDGYIVGFLCGTIMSIAPK